ncbi:MAG: DNA-3-methyladenine glycosylase family protein [Halocynthiibacter sp.]
MQQLITHADDVTRGMEWLAAECPRFAYAYSLTGDPALRRRKDGFEALLQAIVSQQVSVASAAAIWKRLKDARMTGPRKIKGASEEDLRALGLSRQKVRYAKALAAEGINFKSLRDMNSDEVIRILTNVTGIGVWTAEIYAMFSLGHADVFAPGDLALQEAARHLYDLPERPKERAFREMAMAWSPYRSVAARGLWAYYHHIKSRDGVL